MLKSLFPFYSIESFVAIESKIICFFIDPPETLEVESDTSILCMQTAQAAGYVVAYFCQNELFYENGAVKALLHFIDCTKDVTQWFVEKDQRIVCLYEVAAVIIRKDPPFDQNYLYATQLLDLVVTHNVLVSNAPQGIRDANEKIFTTHFAHLMVETLISCDLTQLKVFLAQHHTVVAKMLTSHGGKEVILLESRYPSAGDILTMMTQSGTQPILVQKFIPEITAGNKRILLIGGMPAPFALVRTPQATHFISNAAAGGVGTVQALNEQDRALCMQLTSTLQSKGLDFVGIDVIHGYLSEINVTSPSGLKFIEQESGIDLAPLWLKEIDARLKNR